jgi:hypothetical protein
MPVGKTSPSHQLSNPFESACCTAHLAGVGSCAVSRSSPLCGVPGINNRNLEIGKMPHISRCQSGATCQRNTRDLRVTQVYGRPLFCRAAANEAAAVAAALSKSNTRFSRSSCSSRSNADSSAWRRRPRTLQTHQHHSVRNPLRSGLAAISGLAMGALH